MRTLPIMEVILWIKKTKILIAIFALGALTGGFDTIMAVSVKALVLMLTIFGVKSIIENFKKE